MSYSGLSWAAFITTLESNSSPESSG